MEAGHNKKQKERNQLRIFLTITLLPSIPSTTTLAPSSTALFSTSIAGHSSPPDFYITSFPSAGISLVTALFCPF